MQRHNFVTVILDADPGKVLSRRPGQPRAAPWV